MQTKIKICGIKDKQSLDIAINNGADFIGFVFFKKSPRNISIEIASKLIKSIPNNCKSVALVVNPSKEELTNIIKKAKPDFIQLHGQEEIALINWIKENFTVKIIKAIPVSTKQDLEDIKTYEDICDWLLFDAKPLENELPGGNGINFDWNIIKDIKIKTPWLLAGGLTSDNVSSAIQLTHPNGVDVSSGIESSAGIKDKNKIIEFINNAQKNK